MEAKPINITAEELRSILHYDPETGIFRWHNCPWNIAGGPTPYGYWRIGIRINGKDHRFQAHRLAYLYITGEQPPPYLDHRNLDKSDNRWCNLRPATKAQNSMNRGLRKDNTSGHKGVRWHKGARKWMVQIGGLGDGKYHYGGLFENFDDAVTACDAIVTEVHGEYARTA